MPNNILEGLPFLVKLIALFVGGLVSLVLGGDIYLNEQDELVVKSFLNCIIKMSCAIGIGFYFGSFFVTKFNYDYISNGIFYMTSSAFGMLVFGSLYRAYQLTTHEKTLSEIVKELKNTLKACIK